MEKDLSTNFKDLNEAERSFMAALDGARKAVADAVNFIKEEKREEFEAQERISKGTEAYMKSFDACLHSIFSIKPQEQDALEGRR